MFKVGDKVKMVSRLTKVHETIAGHLVKFGEVYTVEKFKSGNIGVNSLIFIKNTGETSNVWSVYFKLVSQDSPAISSTTEIKPCTCESRTLFIKGCVCGHLVRRAG